MEQDNSGSYQPPKFCPQCGTKVTREGAKFCTQCGKNFVKKNSPPDQLSNHGSTPVAPMPVSSTPSSQPAPLQGSQNQGQGFSQSTADGYSPGTRTNKTSTMITPNDIRGINEPMFIKEELMIIGIFALVATGSHLFRYFLLFDSFPSIWNLIVPFPIYVVVIAIMLAIQKYLFHDKGVHIEFNADRFDYTRSLVFSSFFLTLLPPRTKIIQEKSKVPDEIYIPQSGQYGMKYEPVSRSKYLGAEVRPRMHFFSNLFIAAFAFILVIFYFRIDDPNFKLIFRFVSLYVSSYVMVELAPFFGRNNEIAGEYGRIRSFLIFLLGTILFLTSLLGERFFVALQNLDP